MRHDRERQGSVIYFRYANVSNSVGIGGTRGLVDLSLAIVPREEAARTVVNWLLACLLSRFPTRALKVAGYRGNVAKLGVVAYLDDVLELERAAVQPVQVPDDNGIDTVLANVGDEALVLWPRRAAVRTDVVVGVDVGDVPAPRFGQGPAVLELASNAGSLALPIVTDSGVACGPFHYAPSTTLTCGTGSCAAVAASIARGDVTSDTVRVRLPGGTLVVRPRGDRYELAGPAEYVFTGQTT